MISLLALSLSILLVGQTPPATPVDQPSDAANTAAARLSIMRRSLLNFNIHLSDRPGPSFRLQPEPVLRFNNPVGVSQDGAIFFWLGDGDRPEVAVQVFLHRNAGNWVQDFTSLSPTPLIAETKEGAAWTPRNGGVQFKPMTDAPKPAETAEQRLRQMRDLAQDFAAEDNFQSQSWQRLRLLPTPLARYGKTGTSLIDGALYGFVLATDPEVYLMLEARTGRDGAEWQFAFAPMSSYELKGFWKSQEVWTVPLRGPRKRGSDQPFHTRFFESED